MSRSSWTLVVYLLLLQTNQSIAFRFGGRIPPRLLNPGAFRRDDAVAIAEKTIAPEQPAPAASKGDGDDFTSTSSGSRRRTPKANNMPGSFPMKRLRFGGAFEDRDDTVEATDQSISDPAEADVGIDAGLDDNDEEENDQLHSIVNSAIEEIQNDSSPVSGAFEVGEEDDERGKRVTFFASKESTKVLSLNGRVAQLLDNYMTLPLEQYSVKSFHDGGPERVEGRRWFFRRLDEEESMQYASFHPSDNHEEYMNNGPFHDDLTIEDIVEDERGRFFRLAVPLKPLIGVELTPVIDLEVIPALKPEEEQSSEVVEEDESASLEPDSPGRQPRRRPLRAVRRAIRRRVARRSRRNAEETLSEETGVVQVQSLRVSLLSQEDEVKSLMRNRGRRVRPNTKSTQVSRNPSVQQIGTEAIGVVGKIEQAIRPHITFDARITWDSTTGPRSPSITVKSTAVTSLTIPPIPTAFRVPLPLPLGILVRRIGSILTKRALDITLPRFLNQLERDFERWAEGDTENRR